jgi:hypothetical protein
MRPLSAQEMTDWGALWKIEDEEQRRAMAESKSRAEQGF